MDIRRIEVSKLSRQYEVRILDDSDADTILELYKENQLFYQYTEVKPTIEQVADDMYVTPPGMTLSSKYYIGFYHNSELVAVMDLIDGYPKPEIAYIGLLMVRMHWQGKQVGSVIIGEAENYLQTVGIRTVRLAINKGNPQSTHFWKKNGYIIQREVYKEGWGPLLEAEKAISNACSKMQQMEIKMNYRIATVKDIDG